MMLAPFDDHGNLCHDTFLRGVIEWRQNIPFTTVLSFQQFSYRHHTPIALWQDQGGHTYPMMLKELGELLRSRQLREAGPVCSAWTVVKRGSVYGVKLVQEETCAQ